MLLYLLIIMTYMLIPLMMSLIFLLTNMFITIDIPLINIYSFQFSLTILLDWMSCLFLSTVMLISSMIIMFSMFYIPPKEHKKFLLMLTMFVISMSFLILSDNLIFILLGWDGLGLSSYILVIYYQNYSSAASGTITILTNRIGDIMILLSIALLSSSLNWNFSMNENYNTIVLLLLMIAAISKSAQFPFSAWLPAAMAAPTPISALVHSSTLVTAGVFLMLRLMNNTHPLLIIILSILSSMTTIYASLSANWEQDMKKIIALSTLSQIAMMMFAISMKSIPLAFFHLITHALFKSMMFLCAGIMIHNSSYQDMRMMGLNMINSPSTTSIMGISTMALMGIPFMSGFFSKDSIIDFMLQSKMNSTLSFIMIMSLGMTASYSMRMIKFSNKLMIKSKSEYMFHNNILASLSITFMAPLSIIMGASMLWTSFPHQIFLIPTKMKLLILMTMLMGMILGVSLNFKNNMYMKLGSPSISLWYTHLISTLTFIKLSNSMNLMFKNDNSWQEIYGPQGTFYLNKTHSKMITLTMSCLMFLFMFITMTPLFIM